MAGRTNLDKLRERFLARQTQKDNADLRWWKPEIGKKYKLRILPPPDGGELWFKEYGVHYKVYPDADNPTETCPRLTKGSACPICEFVRGLWRTGTDEDKSLARDIGAKKRYVSNVVIIGSDDVKTPRLWAYGPMIWDQIMAFVNTDDGIIPLDDPATGHNIILTVTEKKTGTQTFPNYVVSPEIKQTAVPDQGCLAKIHDFEDIIDSKLRPYEAIRAQLEGKAEPSQTEEAPVDTPTETDTPSIGTPETPAEGEQTIDDTPKGATDGSAQKDEAKKPEAASTGGGQNLVNKARAALAKRKAK